MQNTPYDSRRLARFIAASGLTNLADGIAVLAWAWVASLITRDALWIALAPIALRSPWFLFAIPAGIVTDRVDRRRLIFAADTVRVVAFALVTLVLWQALPLPPAAPRGLAQRSWRCLHGYPGANLRRDLRSKVEACSRRMYAASTP
ncbi:MFS transporter [Phaeovulum sp.]|uniref:MFS transporter n=1 Tax=Phaeovulum sp. TaxID=2934796 RepID=UPI00272EFE54|nr:MFS transporter [Phaeovulum sp.]MDP1669093.1 MFS transporter [Phaeovulum sp.]MDZ4117732.1 MFS transporter [Phaeovulum sp.]